jgi:hypothetical protein
MSRVHQGSVGNPFSSIPHPGNGVKYFRGLSADAGSPARDALRNHGPHSRLKGGPPRPPFSAAFLSTGAVGCAGMDLALYFNRQHGRAFGHGRRGPERSTR